MKSTLTTMALLAATVAQAEPEFRLGASLGSYHLPVGQSTYDFKQLNLGGSMGVTFNADQFFQYGLQAGVYDNSFGERTIYGLAFIDWRLFGLGRGEIRAGAFAGFFEYDHTADRAREVGWPAIGDYVLALGPTVKYVTPRGISYNVGFVPMQSVHTKGVFTFSMSFPSSLASLVRST